MLLFILGLAIMLVSLFTAPLVVWTAPLHCAGILLGMLVALAGFVWRHRTTPRRC